MTDTKPKPTHYTIDEQSGHSLAHYESGVIYDQDAGRLVHGPSDPALNPIIRDPQGMHQHRMELAQQRAWNALDEAAIRAGKIDVSKAGTGEGYYQLCLKVGTLILEAKTGREIESLLPTYLRMLGIGGPKVEFEGKVIHSVNRDVAQLIEFLREALQPQLPESTEGEVIGDESNTTP